MPPKTQEDNKSKFLYHSGDELLQQNDTVQKQKPVIKYTETGYLEADCKDELLKFHPEVVLYCPQIPPNTGTIARMCAAFSCTLHLIEPMGFQITEKELRRAGLDYWQYVTVYLHKSWQHFLKTRKNRRMIFIETGGNITPMDFDFEPGDLLIFGAETFGIPNEIIENELQNNHAHKITIPMFNLGVRSLNLSNTVSIITHIAISKLHKK